MTTGTGATTGTWLRRGRALVIDLGATPAWDGSPEAELESGRPTLRSGSQGSVVRELQARLASLGFDPGPIDGYFGSLSASAVRAFQRARGLSADGIVGSQTWAALDAQVGPPSPAPWEAPRPSRPAASPGSGRRAVSLDVPFYGYQSNDKAGCFRRCTEMAAAVGVRVGGPDVRIQVAIREDTQGRVTIDAARAREGIAYIDARLDAGDPVVVGVSYMDAAYNVDDITDHFVIITRRGTDGARELYYGFHDPASSHPATGSDQNVANRFFCTPDGGLFRLAAASAPLGSKIYDVSMVRRNL
jgi:peptidoglycan hydrolase-like protein with peptidoglycan-binding domain